MPLTLNRSHCSIFLSPTISPNIDVSIFIIPEKSCQKVTGNSMGLAGVLEIASKFQS